MHGLVRDSASEGRRWVFFHEIFGIEMRIYLLRCVNPLFVYGAKLITNTHKQAPIKAQVNIM